MVFVLDKIGVRDVDITDGPCTPFLALDQPGRLGMMMNTWRQTYAAFALYSLVLLQSYNTAVNYANRSGQTVSYTKIAQSYALAVVTSCSMAFGLGKVGVEDRLLVPSFTCWLAG